MDVFANNSTLSSLEIGLNALSQRYQASASNVSNSETPLYSAQKVNFEDNLTKVLDQLRNGNQVELEVTDSKHFDILPNTVLETKISKFESNSAAIANQNNVNIDQEMLTMAKTGMKFKALSRMSTLMFQNLNGVIRG